MGSFLSDWYRDFYCYSPLPLFDLLFSSPSHALSDCKPQSTREKLIARIEFFQKVIKILLIAGQELGESQEDFFMWPEIWSPDLCHIESFLWILFFSSLLILSCVEVGKLLTSFIIENGNRRPLTVVPLCKDLMGQRLKETFCVLKEGSYNAVNKEYSFPKRFAKSKICSFCLAVPV